MAEPPGWYGKLAMLGDFAQRRLPDEVVQRLDRWLAAAMQALPHTLGERWPQAYLEAPLLHFAWAPGVLGPAWWFGVLMPSCDRVGRYFPLLLAQAAAQPPHDSAGLERLAAWYEAAGSACLQTLEDGASLAGFEAALAAIEPWPGPDARARRWVDAVHGLARDALAVQLAGQGLWWTATRPTVLHRVPGLADVATTVWQLDADPSETAPI